MSTIYTDVAGNKYLGDCRWGNHDINFPSTNYLQSVATTSNNIYYSGWRDDAQALLTDASYTSMTWDTSTSNNWPETGSTIFQATFPVGGFWFRLSDGGFGARNTLLNNVISRTIAGVNPWRETNYGTDYAVCAGAQSLSMSFWISHSGSRGTYTGYPTFFYAGKLLDVNTEYGYYSGSVNNQLIYLSLALNNNPSVLVSTGSLSVNQRYDDHFITNARKSLLQTGLATYTISCSDGQTPGSQWATDMWVYDNNATLGYPVIGRVPNMLLGIGTYTYLKPVKIEGSVFPDGGSPWYLPVGIFAGKTLLMRCYSSVT